MYVNNPCDSLSNAAILMQITLLLLLIQLRTTTDYWITLEFLLSSFDVIKFCLVKVKLVFNANKSQLIVSSVQFYLVDSELSIFCVTLLKLLVPIAFEVDGIHQHQSGHVVHHTLGQHILNFTWGFEVQIWNDEEMTSSVTVFPQ